MAGPGFPRPFPLGPAISLTPHHKLQPAVITGMSVVTAKLDWGSFCDGKRPWSRTKRRTDQRRRTGRDALANAGGQLNVGEQSSASS